MAPELHPLRRSLLAAALCTQLGALGCATLQQNAIAPVSRFLTAKKDFRTAGNFLESGSIVLSRQVPARPAPGSIAPLAEAERNDTLPPMAPLVGYFPPSTDFLPADNELWIELDRAAQSVAVFSGNDLVETISGEGIVTLAPGKYYLESKKEYPLWHAPDSYFTKRHLAVPPATDPLRERRGALGEMALYASPGFPIHSSAIWNEDVGGLRIPEDQLKKYLARLPIGTPIRVR